MRIYESADPGMRHNRSKEDEPVDFQQASLEFGAVQKQIDQQFGHAVADQIAHKQFAEPPAASPDQLCAARIYQLEAMLKRPKGTASMLIDSILR